MPEGDTIYRSARALSRALAGKVVTGFETALAQLASVDDNTPLAGRTVETVEARGKWLLIHLTGDLILTTHMLMSGSWHIYRVGERWRVPRGAMRCVLRVAGTADEPEFEAVAFNVPVAKFFTARTLERNSAIPALGPDLLAAGYDEAEARRRILAQSGEDIANVLLNQRVLAGLGNVYKSEVCFLCGVHPFRPVATLTPSELDCLLFQSRKLIGLNVLEGSGDKILTYTGARRTTHSSDQGSRLWVYGRQGQPCRRCGTAVMSRKQGLAARSTYWCPQCQPGDESIQGRTTPVRRKRVGC